MEEILGAFFTLISPTPYLLRGALVTMAGVDARMHLPSDDRHTQNGTETAKDQSDDPSSRKPVGKGLRREILPSQVKEVLGIGGCIASNRDACVAARFVVVFRYLEGLLDVEGGFDQGGDETAINVPFDVAVEEPDTRVIGLEPEDKMAERIDHKSVSSHGHPWRLSSVGRIVRASVWIGTHYGLEYVTVKMKGMFPGVMAIEDDFDDIVLLEDERVGATTVDGDIVCGLTGGHEGIEGGNLWTDIGGIVEECTDMVRLRRFGHVNSKLTNWLRLPDCPCGSSGSRNNRHLRRSLGGRMARERNHRMHSSW